MELFSINIVILQEHGIYVHINTVRQKQTPVDIYEFDCRTNQVTSTKYNQTPQRNKHNWHTRPFVLHETPWSQFYRVRHDISERAWRSTRRHCDLPASTCNWWGEVIEAMWMTTRPPVFRKNYPKKLLVRYLLNYLLLLLLKDHPIKNPITNP